ncbi:uncharacterized protein LOC142539173 isoform X2 [Primulina tabacum]|uniref:uncharacterized protein LOC142539173 isoform X2 n=1 Tax=Primulina tabacum TaxID=48773 RepID=UPI003F5997D0
MASIQDNAAAEVEDVIDEEESVKKEAPAEAPKAVKIIMDDHEEAEEVAAAALYHEGKLEYSDDEDEDQGETESPIMERSEDTPFNLSELKPTTGLNELDDDDDVDHDHDHDDKE